VGTAVVHAGGVLGLFRMEKNGNVLDARETATFIAALGRVLTGRRPVRISPQNGNAADFRHASHARFDPNELGVRRDPALPKSLPLLNG
jgi:hypothetical protein